MKGELSHISKFLRYVLRRNPEVMDLKPDEQGWFEVNALIAAANKHGQMLDRELLEEIVAAHTRRRFAFSEDGTKIRALRLDPRFRSPSQPAD